jgi:hypothetical protein
MSFPSLHVWLRLLLPGIALPGFPPAAHGLQTSASLRVDNDFFNFWDPLAKRPDEEYTQGTNLALRWSGTGVVLPRLLRGLAPCANAPPTEGLCGRLSVSLGQDMYTPSIDSPQLLPGQRPYAGWLYLEGTERAEGARRLDVVRVTIGVTGPPSLAESTQDLWHRWFNFRQPLGWAEQLPFEVDLTLGYEGARTMVRLPSADSPHLILAPVWGLNAGTLLTDLELGLRATVGWHPPVPWVTTLRRPRSVLGLYLLAGVRGDVVARNLFLDGTTFRASPRVARNVLVGQVEGGIGLSVGRVRLEWTVIHRGREYATQPRPHTYARLALGWN